MSWNTIGYEVDDRVLTITLNRPDHRNAVTYEMLDELLDAFDRAQADDDVRVIVLTGAGDFFSTGTDLSAGGGGYDAASSGFKSL